MSEERYININSNEFISSLKKGDESTFTSLFKELNVPLCSYAYRILNDMDEARDVVQAVFYKIWDQRGEIEITESLKSYLYKSVYNNCINSLRKSKRFNKFQELGLGDVYFNRIVQSPHAELAMIDSETRKVIVGAINELPNRCRQVFVKCKIEGESYNSVAKELNISVKTVESQMSIALKRLRLKLDWLMILLLIS